MFIIFGLTELINTDLTVDLKVEVPADLIGRMALSRVGTPVDVARTVLFFASTLRDFSAVKLLVSMVAR